MDLDWALRIDLDPSYRLEFFLVTYFPIPLPGGTGEGGGGVAFHIVLVNRRAVFQKSPDLDISLVYPTISLAINLFREKKKKALNGVLPCLGFILR